jgi:hypothetical protein
MKRGIILEIECGETTCASEPGRFCRFLGRQKFGSISVCMLFPDPDGQGSDTTLRDQDGWIRRCPACMNEAQDMMCDAFVHKERTDETST